MTMQAGSELSVGLGTLLGGRRRPNRKDGPEPYGKERRIFEFENTWNLETRPETRLLPCAPNETELTGAACERMLSGAEEDGG